NDKLPSINKIAIANGLSRDTVLQAYDELKKRGVVYSIIGKGYFIKSLGFQHEQNLFLLFDELNSFKELIYNGFYEEINKRAEVDIFFHHFNLPMFDKLITENAGRYSNYIIMPSNLQGTAEIIAKLPKEDVYILDQTNETLSHFPSVYQDFAKDMKRGLTEVQSRLKYYRKLFLIYPGNKEPIGMVEGFQDFCSEIKFPSEVIHSVEENSIQKGAVFVIPNDDHLVEVIEITKSKNLEIGKHIGIISYNDIPLKKVIENGITTISTDFYQMGKTMGRMGLSGKKQRLENPSRIVLRQSL
ncbi:MAG: GntR family transcriptional regulator, partial [Crocinitomicaceae bacterium]|nr:GntR family transcriptional regulator [Crocinitomicaceae bacterium]